MMAPGNGATVVACSYVVQVRYANSESWSDYQFCEDAEGAIRQRDERQEWFPDDRFRAVTRCIYEEVIEQSLVRQGFVMVKGEDVNRSVQSLVAAYHEKDIKRINRDWDAFRKLIGIDKVPS